MQNQLFRGLFMSLFALTLSACVGAVNIGGTSPQDTLINRCIVGNTAQSDPTCAKAVADTNGCITNPFLSGCEANPVFSRHVQNARDERVKFCNDANNEDDNHCTGSDSVKDICTHDPFGRVCDGLYYQERKLICEDTLTFPRCADTVSKVCNTDPFNTDLCFQDNAYNNDRESACRYSSRTERCATTVSRVCESDPFNIALCFGDNAYDSMREITCANESESPRCKTTVNRVCRVDIFDSLCKERFNNSREQRCMGERDSKRCEPTITRVCTADSLSSLCEGDETYFTAQEMACANTPNNHRCTATTTRLCNKNPFHDFCNSNFDIARERACEDEPNSDRCTPIVARVCGLDFLDTLCSTQERYFGSQYLTCKNEPTSPRCAPTVLRVCGADSLDPICKGHMAYFPEQKTACAEAMPNSPRCAPIVAGICGADSADAFSTFCQSKNLTQHDIIGQLNGTGSIRTVQVTPSSDYTPSGTCLSPTYNRGNHNCISYIPGTINIKPLNDTNSGTAMYVASVKIQYISNSNPKDISSNNINITADFDNNRLSYSGNLVSSSSSTFAFSIDGAFTNRGVITGTVNFNSNEGQLFGLIGQDNAIGGFFNKISFAGGFTATRQK